MHFNNVLVSHSNVNDLMVFTPLWIEKCQIHKLLWLSRVLSHMSDPSSSYYPKLVDAHTIQIMLIKFCFRLHYSTSLWKRASPWTIKSFVHQAERNRVTAVAAWLSVQLLPTKSCRAFSKTVALFFYPHTVCLPWLLKLRQQQLKHSGHMEQMD